MTKRVIKNSFILKYAIKPDNYIKSFVWDGKGRNICYLDEKQIITVDSENGTILNNINVDYFFNEIDWNPKKEQVVLSGDSIEIWDLINNELIIQLEERPPDSKSHLFTLLWSNFGKVKFNPSGTLVACIVHKDKEKSIQIWDAIRGNKTITLAHKNKVEDFNWSLDGRRIASKTTSSQGMIWSIDTGNSIFTIEKCTGDIKWSPSGKYLAYGSKNSIYLLDAQNFSKLNTFSAWGQSFDWNSDECLLAVDQYDYINIIDFQKGNLLFRIYVERSSGCKWHPCLNYLAINDYNHLLVWEPNDARIWKSLSFKSGIYRAIWSKDGNCLAVAYENNIDDGKDINFYVEVLDYKFELLNSINVEFIPEYITFSLDNSKLAVSTDDGKILEIWDVNSAERIKHYEGNDFYHNVQWDPKNCFFSIIRHIELVEEGVYDDGKNWKFTTSGDGFTEIIDLNNWNAIFSKGFEAINEKFWPVKCCWLSNGNVFVYAEKSKILFYNTLDWSVTNKFTFSDDIIEFFPSNDESKIAVIFNSHDSAFLSIFDISLEIKEDFGVIEYTEILWSPDNKYVVISIDYKLIKIINVNNKKIYEIKFLDGFKSVKFQFSNDGNSFITLESDVVKIYDTNNFLHYRTLYTEKGNITKFCSNPTKNILLTIQESNNEILLWNIGLLDFLKNFYLLTGLKTISEVLTMTEQNLDDSLPVFMYLLHIPKRYSKYESMYLQKQYIKDIRLNKKNEFWNFLDYLSFFDQRNDKIDALEKVYQKWNFRLFLIQESKRTEILSTMERGVQKNFLIENRSQNMLEFQVIIEDIPYYLHPLIKNIIINVESDRGDIHSLKFTDFYFWWGPEHLEYQSSKIFKIDENYRQEKYVLINISDVIIEYDENLMPDGVKKNSKLVSLGKKIDHLINLQQQQVLLLDKIFNDKTKSTADLPTIDFSVAFEEISDPKEWIDYFALFNELWIEPNFPQLQIQVGKGAGTWFGKWAERLQAGLIVAGSFPGIIQYVIRLIFNVEKLPLYLELISYVPVIMILFYLTIRFHKSQKE